MSSGKRCETGRFCIFSDTRPFTTGIGTVIQKFLSVLAHDISSPSINLNILDIFEDFVHAGILMLAKTRFSALTCETRRSVKSPSAREKPNESIVEFCVWLSNHHKKA